MATASTLDFPWSEQWVQHLLEQVQQDAPALHAEAVTAINRWAGDANTWAYIERVLRDAVDITGFIARADVGDDVLGITTLLARALTDATLVLANAELQRQWKFLLMKPSPLTASSLRLVYERLDSWQEIMPNKIQQIRQNPFWLMQLDRQTLADIYQESPQKADRNLPTNELRYRWMKFLQHAWRVSPDKVDVMRTTYTRWAAVLGMLMQVADKGHTYALIKDAKHKRNAKEVAHNLTSVRKFLDQPEADDDEVRGWIDEVCALSSKAQSPVLRSYKVIPQKSDQDVVRVQWMWLYMGEKALATQVPERLARPLYPWPTVGDAVLAEGYVDGDGVRHDLDPLQQAAIRQLYVSPFSILNAPPGTGKTTVIGILHKIFLQDPHRDGNFRVVTPTGRSAHVATQAIAQAYLPLERRATTLHSAVSSARAAISHQDTPFKGALAPDIRSGFAVVDEAFATDAGILGAYASLLGFGGRFILVGDADQLLPVTGGAPAFDLTQVLTKAHGNREIAVNPVVTLKVIHRSVPVIIQNSRALWDDPVADPVTGADQIDGAGNRVYASHQWDSEHFPMITMPGVADNPQLLVDDLLATVQTWEQAARDAHVLSTEQWHVMTWRRMDAAFLNRQIREKLFPEIITAGVNIPFVVGERIVQNRNDLHIGKEGISNGEFAVVTEVTPKTITANFGRDIVTVSTVYANQRWSKGYVTTVHKAQGGEWDRVAFVHLPKTWVQDQIAQLESAYTVESVDVTDKKDEVASQVLDKENDAASSENLQAFARRVVYVAWSRARTIARFYAVDPDDAVLRVTRHGGPRHTRENRRTRLQGFTRWAMFQAKLPQPPGTGGMQDL